MYLVLAGMQGQDHVCGGQLSRLLPVVSYLPNGMSIHPLFFGLSFYWYRLSTCCLLLRSIVFVTICEVVT